MGEKVAGSSKLGVDVSLRLSGEDAGLTEFRCGSTSVRIDRYGTASGLGLDAWGTPEGRAELLALFEAVAHVYHSKGMDGRSFR